MNDPVRNEMRALSNMIIVGTIMVFTVALTVFTLYYEWDKWTVPVFFTAAAACFIMHIIDAPEQKHRIHICCAVWFTELFYYVFNTNTLYESLFAAMISLAILGLTGERRLLWICMLTIFTADVSRLCFLPLEPGGRIVPQEVVQLLIHYGLIFIVGLIADRTLKKNEESREQFFERIRLLEQENKTADDFLANVSHEIRTPVNVVIGLTDISLEQETNPAIRANLEAVSRAGRRVAEQISDILDYSEIEMNRVVINPEDYTPAALTLDLEAELRPFLHPGLELILDIDPLLPSIMRSDPIKLKRILWHLIMNGIKYTKEGGVYAGLSFTRQEYGINLCIDVRDTGPGMTMEEVDRIYDRFYQSDSGRSRSSGGLGLGMSIVAGVVESLEGFITLDSRPGEGTRVHVCIPQEVVVPAPCLALEQEGRLIGTLLDFEKFPNPNVREFYLSSLKHLITGLELSVRRFKDLEDLRGEVNRNRLTHLFVGEMEYLSAPEYLESLTDQLTLVIVCREGFSPGASSRARLIRKPYNAFSVADALKASPGHSDQESAALYTRGVRALAVDDEPMNLMVVKTLLGRRYGIEVICAESGLKAIELCREESFDLIFMDHMMPGMDGIEAARRIRAEAAGRGAQMPIVALTANAASTARAMFIAEGFDGFLRKPIERMELERILVRILPPDKLIRGKEPFSEREAAPALEKTEEKPVSEESTSPGDWLKELEEAGLDTGMGLEYCVEDEDFYRSVLKEFVQGYEAGKAGLEQNYYAGDWENFRIRVHALKSTAKTIGAKSLSEKARILEGAARAGKNDFIREHFPELLPEYLQVSEAIKNILEEKYVK